MGRSEAAAIILRRVLPSAVLAFVDLDRIQVAPTAYVGPLLRKGYSDLVYTIGLRGCAEHLFVFAAIEHDSSSTTSDTPLVLRMFWYVGWLWERHLATTRPRPNTIPLILPIVMVQNPDKWKGPNHLSALIDIPPALKKALSPPIELMMWVDDLGESVLDDPVANPEVLALVELTRALLLAYHHPASITPARIQHLAPLFDTVLRSSREDAEALWTYVSNVFNEDSPLRTMLLDAVGKENQVMGRTYKEAWLAEGTAKGITQGIATSLLHVLKHRQWTISTELERRVLDTQDEPTLRRWFQRALAADSLDRVFEPAIEGP
ncbi:MAG: Rpn family recombination-promoting nuclease/putative transposase [Myxococcota bacterium]